MPQQAVVEVRFVFVRYCWAALTAKKFYGRRQNTIDCLKFEWSARVSIVFASGRARANEVAFVVISNLCGVPGEQSLSKNQVVGRSLNRASAWEYLTSEWRIHECPGTSSRKRNCASYESGESA